MYFFDVFKRAVIEPNVLIANVITIPIIFIGMYINLLIFKNFLQLEISRKQIHQYVFFAGLWNVFCNIFIPNPLGLYVNCLILPRNRYVDF